MIEDIYIKDNGSLQGYAIPDILEILGKRSVTGMLRVERDHIIKVIYLKDGVISFASSNDPKDRLGEILINMGKITRTQLDDAIQRLKPNISLGKMLVQLGYLSGKDLLIGAQKQSELIIISLFNWSNGNYSFIEGPLPKQLVDLKMDLNKIIYQGILTNASREWVIKHIGSMESIFILKYDENKIYEKLQMSEEEKSIMPFFNGKRTLSEISSFSKLEDFQICKIIAALKLLDFAQKIEKGIITPEKLSIQQEKTKLPINEEETVFESEDVQEEYYEDKSIEGKEEEQILDIPESKATSDESQLFFTEEKEAAVQIKEEFLDEAIAKQPPELETKVQEEAISQKLYSEHTSQIQNQQPEDVNNKEILHQAISSDELIFQLTNEEHPDKRRLIILTIISLLVISIIIIALVYYLRYKENEPLIIAKETITQEAKKEKESEAEKLGNISIVSIPKPIESLLPNEVIETTTNEITPPPQPKQKTTPTTIVQNIQPKPEITSGKITEKELHTPSSSIEEEQIWKQAQSAFLNNNFFTAANIWKNNIKNFPTYYTVQVELACQNDTITEAYNLIKDKNKFYLLPKKYKNNQCYIIGYGIFKNKQEADNNYNELPEILLKQQYPPRIITIAELLK